MQNGTSQTPKSKTSNQVFGYDYSSAGRGPIIWGLFVLVPLFIGLGIWATVAPLNAAAIANGEVVLTQDRKTIQHLEGGIVDEIFVREGETIEKDAPIFVVRDVRQRTQMNTLHNQLANARALKARLVAERDSLEPEYAALKEGIDLTDDDFADIQSMQTRLFESRQKSIGTKIELIKARKEAFSKEIEGLRAQLKATKKRLTLLRKDLSKVGSLFEQKLTTAVRMGVLENDIAELEGQEGEIISNIARLEQSVLGADIEVIDLQTDTRNEVLTQLQETELRVQELTQNLAEMRDQLARTIIRAPVAGRVIDVQIHTNGAVIQPGQRLLDIVPIDDRLIVEARINPNDIDLVEEGGVAKVVLSAYKERKVPKLDGTILNISADILTDEATNERYFLARVLVDDEILKKLTSDVALYPGMPAQVFLLAGERTMAEYILAPVQEATYRAFRED